MEEIIVHRQLPISLGLESAQISEATKDEAERLISSHSFIDSQTPLIGSGRSWLRILKLNFLGHSPNWYKNTILAFLVLNPLLSVIAGNFVAGWIVVCEFLFTLAMALKCYPLQPVTTHIQNKQQHTTTNKNK